MTDRGDLERAERDAETEAAAAAGAAGDPEAGDAAVDPEAGDDPQDRVPTANEYSIAFSPRNVAVGLAIVAGLVAVVAARRRNRPGEDG